MKPIVILVSVCLVFLFTSCDKCNPKSNKAATFKLVDMETDTFKFDSIDNIFQKEDKNFLLLSKGATWKTWKKLHKGCMKSEWLKHPFYFGVTNTINLGSIIDEELGLQRLLDQSNGFTADELKEIFKPGEFAQCDYSQDLTMSIKTFIQSDFDFTSDGQSDVGAELDAAISNSRNTKVKIDYWRLNSLHEGKLIDIISDAPSTDLQKQRFFEDLLKNKNRIISKVIEIKGFSALIILDTDVSSTLEMKLKEGIVAGLGTTQGKLEFKLKNKRTIEAKSSGNFYVFSELKQGKKI